MPAKAPPAIRFVIVTLDAHLAGAFERARQALRRDLPGLDLRMHVAADWDQCAEAVERCCADLQVAHFVLVTQLFQEELARHILPTLQERSPDYDALCCALSTGELVRLTRLGRFAMAAEAGGSPWSLKALLRKLRGAKQDGRSPGERQMAMLRAVPALLKWIPGTAQDVRSYFLALQYWLGGSETNLGNLVRMLVSRYGAGERRLPSESLRVAPPEFHPEIGVYHPDLPGLGMSEDHIDLPARGRAGTVGLLVGRSYLLAGNTAHYDAVIRALEARGLSVIPAFASALDARPAIERFMRGRDGRATIDALISLTGFSLVGGPAYSDAPAAAAVLEALDVPYLSLQSLEFQSVEAWRRDPRGLNPLQATLQVALPELDGAVGPLVFGGRGEATTEAPPSSQPIEDRVELLARRVARLVALRRRPRAERRLAIVLFNFPPNAGNTGSAAYLAVFPSLQRVLAALKEQGYRVDLPDGVDALKQAILGGNATTRGTPANVHAQVSLDEHVRREPFLAELERVWGPAPGRQLSDGASLFVMGARFGNVFVGVQPAFGWEGDPMRLLFEGNFAPTHAFTAFYRWIREDFGADQVLHFGTHGALEFMPGKQVGLSADCWPDRLIGDLPNIYLYASNNSSEGTLAKRRGAATLVSYLTPPLSNAGLYRRLADLKSTLDRYRATDPAAADRPEIAALLQSQAAAVELAAEQPRWSIAELDARVAEVRDKLLELEYALIPIGLHVVGEPMSPEERRSTLAAVREAGCGGSELERAARYLEDDHEIPGLLRALDGRFVPPAPGGDLVRTPAVLPTGRNLYGFDPYRVPSGVALLEGRRRADQLLARHQAGGGDFPETVAMVLWGTDNMKSEGAPIATALALLGAAPRFDEVGRLAGARLLSLEQLGRPRVDVVLSVSGIFRDLLPLQIKLLAEAARLAAAADEPVEQNFVRAHTLEHMRQLGCDFETASLRVFGNADGAYGSNVNLLLDSGRWSDEDELAEQFVRRKGHGYGVNAPPVAQGALLQRALAGASLSFQNLDSVELGTTDIDQYVESLGGMNRVIARERGAPAPAYIGDHTGSTAKIRTLEEQVALETRTRLLNPKWYEAQLRYGYEGVRNLAGHVTTTFGWSATGGQIPQWVYTEVSQTFVLDAAMRERLAALNPTAAAGMAQRLLEANDRGYWRPDDATLDALRQASEDLEDRLEGVATEPAP